MFFIHPPKLRSIQILMHLEQHYELKILNTVFIRLYTKGKYCNKSQTPHIQFPVILLFRLFH
jgi:hypothetical protein